MSGPEPGVAEDRRPLEGGGDPPGCEGEGAGPEPGVAEDHRPLGGEGEPLAVKERVQDPNQAWLKAAVPLKVKATPWPQAVKPSP